MNGHSYVIADFGCYHVHGAWWYLIQNASIVFGNNEASPLRLMENPLRYFLSDDSYIYNTNQTTLSHFREDSQSSHNERTHHCNQLNKWQLSGTPSFCPHENYISSYYRACACGKPHPLLLFRTLGIVVSQTWHDYRFPSRPAIRDVTGLVKVTAILVRFPFFAGTTRNVDACTCSV